MKKVLLFLCFVTSITTIYSQRLSINGTVMTHKELPIQGVLVMAFDNGEMIKSYVTDDKGEYRFFVDIMVFDVLLYKPGMLSHTLRLKNKLDKETQGINLTVIMDDSTAQTAIDLTLWLQKHKITASFVDSLYQERMKPAPPHEPKHVEKNKKQQLKEAEAEQKRFANFKQSTTRDSIDTKTQVTTTLIGPDRYELMISDKRDKKYFKNQKPISEATYRFETTRRYEGVLKKSKNVKHFDRYQPMDHVKG